ncbi:hypothetical protein [Kaistella jeonii]|uniref:hypothetical protein n=1 Tax=Kaistella jeonii TaxID=266749 RepID=UPI00068D9F0C|nr:hypothetical protein [Kaistella jeonii]SFB71862.1 hypothetical protein SAMN05421876_101332 [Kaistella jeonii]VEI94922.1 Uncharacterised protein [Kaistella jeonii]
MKKPKIDFDAEFWSSYRGNDPLQLFDAFFKGDLLSEAKDRLFEIMNYSVKRKVLSQKDPSHIFYFYLSLRSFLRASCVLYLKSEKLELKDPPEYISRLLQGSLSDDEYLNPFLVFRRAFKEWSLTELEQFLTEITYFSLGAYTDLPAGNTITPFIHVQKMLDAAQMIREREFKKQKSKK